MSDKRRYQLKAPIISACLILAVFLFFAAMTPFALAETSAGETAKPATTGTATPSTGDAVGEKPVFTDLTVDNPLYPFVRYLTGKGIIKGFPDGAYQPASGLTRAEAATLIARVSGLSPVAVETSFSDISSHWAASNISAAAAAGYLKGYPDGTFKPDDTITRAEGITLFLRLSKQPDPGVALPALEDMPAGHWAARPVAIALASGMTVLAKDTKSFLPGSPLTRGDLSRALAVLLTKDPGLSKVPMAGTLKVHKGQVLVTRQGQKDPETITATTQINAGDTIKTGSSGVAELVFPDGTGLRLEENTDMAVKESVGRSYITTKGEPGIKVEWLAVDMKKGKMFGALASRNEGQKAGGKKTGSTGLKETPLLADLDNSIAGELFLAAEGDNSSGEAAWWDTAGTNRVRVEVDMPWGVAGIKGSVWQIALKPDGTSSVTMLTGHGQVTSGGSTVNLGATQKTEITSNTAPPAPPVVMTVQELKEITSGYGKHGDGSFASLLL